MSDLLLAECDAWRCYGRLWLAYRTLKLARKVLTQSSDSNIRELVAKAELKRLLLLRHFYQIASLLRLRSKVQELRDAAAGAIRAAAEASLSSGAWFDFQQLSLWTQRFGLPPELTRPPGLYEAPSPREGYQHLAYFVAQMMAFRDELDTGLRPADASAQSDCMDFARLAECLGSHPEAWKLYALLIRRFRDQRTKKNLIGFIGNFKACQYSLSMRLVQLVLGS